MHFSLFKHFWDRVPSIVSLPNSAQWTSDADMRSSNSVCSVCIFCHISVLSYSLLNKCMYRSCKVWCVTAAVASIPMTTSTTSSTQQQQECNPHCKEIASVDHPDDKRQSNEYVMLASAPPDHEYLDLAPNNNWSHSIEGESDSELGVHDNAVVSNFVSESKYLQTETASPNQKRNSSSGCCFLITNTAWQNDVFKLRLHVFRDRLQSTVYCRA